ncbi:MAG: ankyrin repeat domain-containing protein [Acidobacteriia bacterium]|nr:ankyrin repeat domain-containing protein [Terriglobia bacterium]
MKRTLAFLVATAGMILTPNVRAQESVCDLFSHLEISDGQQLLVTGDLIISKDVTILGAADCDNHYTSALSGSQRAWPTALWLHPSAAVNPVQLRQIQHAAAEADHLRSQGKAVMASATFSGRLRLATTGDIPAELDFDSFENLKVEALPNATSLEVIPICALFQNLSNWKGKRVAVRGEFVSTMEGWWIRGNCQGAFVTDGYRWPVVISLGVPAYHSKETADLYQAKWPAVSKGENLKGMPDVIKTVTFVGTLRLHADYHVTCVGNGTYRAFGYGHLDGAAAELIVESIRDFELAPRPDVPIDAKAGNTQQHYTPPTRAELCAQADSLNRAAQRGCVEKVREFLAASGIDSKNGGESEALRIAIRSDNKEIAQLLINAGAPVNPALTALWSPLADAAFAKHFEMMKLLLQSGAKVDAPDHRGMPLLVSTGFFDPTTTTILLEAGADTNATDREGETALMKASGYGVKETVKILIEHHADVNRKDLKGRTALMHAAAGRRSDAIPLLLENGADPNVRDNEGKSALDLADQSNNLGAIAMLSLAVKRSH